MLIATASIVLLVTESSGNLLRRLIPISYNDKYCVDFAPNGEYWLTPYSGTYSYKEMQNNKPSYQMTKCKDANNCKNDAILGAGSNGQWQFGSQTNDPFCGVVTATPGDICNNWWPGRIPSITACGNTQTGDNGLTQAQVDLQTPVGNSLSSADKQALLDAHNAIRRKTAVGQMNGLYTPTASDMISFKWDNGLAYIAQQHCNGCIFEHTTGAQSRSNLYNAKTTRVNDYYLGNVGENLAARQFTTRQDLVNAINSMAEEEAKNWNWNSPNVDHYNQIVSSHTQYVGCGVSQCDGNVKLEWGGMLTCNYYPYYGTTHQHTYLSGTPGSQCPSGSTSDGKGLCDSNNLIFPYTTI